MLDKKMQKNANYLGENILDDNSCKNIKSYNNYQNAIDSILTNNYKKMQKINTNVIF